MYDSFDMACHDASSALQLNIKVNSENLLPNVQKYNVGSLRLPADPSWPKIPQRRMVDDLDGIIEPPCVVTLTGTPRKSRTTVKASHLHQSAKFSYSKDQVPASFHNNYHKVTPTTHPLKRRPGCADPRFKRVMTVKSDVTSNDQPDRENHVDLSRSTIIIPNSPCISDNGRNNLPEKDTDPPKITQQEAEKPGEIRGMDSIGVQTMPTEESSKSDVQKNVEVDTKVSDGCLDSKKILRDPTESEHHKISSSEIGDCKTIESSLTDEKKPPLDSENCTGHGDVESPLGKKINFPKEEYPPPGFSNATNSTPVNLQSESTCLKYCQSNAGQFFLVMENKSQAQTPIALQHDPKPLTTCQYTTQCYNVQVPVLTYQNLPLQISTQTPTKVEIPSQLSLSPVLTIPSTPALKNPANLSSDNASENKIGISEKSDNKIRAENSKALQNFEVSKKIAANSGTPEKSEAQTLKESVDFVNLKHNFNTAENQKESEKNVISTDAASQLARKSLGTPPIKLERKYVDDRKFEDVRIQNLMSDTTDSELYSVNVKQTKPNNLYTKETSCSGSDCDSHFHHQSKFKNDLAQLKKKRRKAIYSSTGIRKYDENCSAALESSMDDQESIKPRDNCKQLTMNQWKMKSEQNLSQYLPFGGRNYKNTSDPHLTTRESCRMEKETFYPSSCPNSGCKCDNRNQEKMSDVRRLNNRETRERTSDVDSDAVQNSPCCDSRRTDLSNIEESKKTADPMPTALPAKTQQLLSKSYMEYYDKLRSSNIENNENIQQRYVCQMAVGSAQFKKRRAESEAQITKINERKDTIPEDLTLEKLSALSNIINRNLNPALKNSTDALQTTHLYVNDNMKSSSDPTAVTESAVVKKIIAGESADFYDSSVRSVTPIDRVKRKREKPVEKKLLKLKTIAFFGFMMYAMIVVLPLMYNFFLYDEYEEYEDLSYIELTLEYVVSSFREAFGGLFDAISDLIFRPVRLE